MRRLFIVIFSLIFFFSKANDLLVENPYNVSFKKAYSLYPSVPKGILEAVAYTQTRFQHVTFSSGESCMGYPRTYGVMGLVADGKNYFRNNLTAVSQLSGFSVEAIISSPEISILAYAAAFQKLQIQKNIFSKDPGDYRPILVALSELPVSNDLQNNFALNSHLYQVYWFLSRAEFQEVYNFPDHQVDLEEIFGENYKVLSSKGITVGASSINSSSGNSYKLTSVGLFSSPDYPPAIYNPAASCNYSSRNGTAISAVTIHFVQGSYAGCISWFQNCAASASAHYVVRSSDGQVTQMVLEASKAWHVGSENPYTVGIEHEGYVNNISWFTTAMYNSSAALTKDICTSNTINSLRTYYGPGCSGTTSQCLQGSCLKVKGHQMYPNQTHTDPGPLWDWKKYYKLINNTYSITATYTASTGGFFDSGGPTANYGNDERKFWLFTKPGATNITLSFTSFSLEPGYDNLFIYDGGTNNSPLIGQYTGTVNPGPFTSTNDSLLVEFRSDCATTASGWAATYTTVTSAQTTTDVIAPGTTVTTQYPWKTATFTTSVTDADNIGGSGVEKGYYQVIDFDGTEWRANYTQGFFADNFDNAIHADWTQKTGSWSINGNALEQSDETSAAAGNTNIYAALTQSLSNRYLYHFLAKFEGSGTSRRGGLHFFCDKPDSVNRWNSYFVWFRLDDQKVQIYKVVNDVFGTPKVDLPLTFNASQWYDIKVIYDRITGKISVYMNNAMVATWTDTSPYSNGDYISFRSGNCKMSIDEIKVYRSRSSSINVTVGGGMANELRYQNTNPVTAAGKIKSICQDSAGNLSPIYYHDVNVDWTTPSTVTAVFDGPAADINIVNTTDSLRANWTPSTDQNSAIMRYWYSIGTSPGLMNVTGWVPTAGANTAVTVHSLNLVHGTTYYFSIMAENGAGLLSGYTNSNGQKVDTTYFVGMEKLSVESSVLKVYPNPFTNKITFTFHAKDDSKMKITVTDVSGREISAIEMKEEKGTKEHSIVMKDDLPAGTYFLKLEVNGDVYHHKLLKH